MIERFATRDATIERLARCGPEATHERDVVRIATRTDRALLERTQQRDQIERVRIGRKLARTRR